ncbi:GDP-mannose 4,6-dehydratase [Pelagibacteraceae bacterium]|nr:GDP-mannose 4,6-dehydratase [Pelagibacteraceae bacterium]
MRKFKNIFITGILGSGGSYLAEFIRKKNANINLHGNFRNINNFHYKILKSKNINLYNCDLNNISKLKKLLQKIKPDLIYHLASNADVRKSFDEPYEIINNNNLCTLNLLEVIRTCNFKPILVMCSTSEVYGAVDSKTNKINEKFPINPENPYSVSKTFQDLLAQNYIKIYGLRIIITRMFSYINPRRTNLFATHWAYQIAQIELKMKKYLIHGNLNTTRAMLDINDAMNAYWIVANKGKIGEVYNIGGQEIFKISRILNILKANSKIKIISKLNKSLLRKKDIKYQIPDSSKFIKDTGWQPEIQIKNSLKYLLEYQRKKLRKW